MEQHKTVILNLTLDEFDRLNAERLGLVVHPVIFKPTNPVYVPRNKKEHYQCSAPPSVIRQIEGRYEILEIRG